MTKHSKDRLIRLRTAASGPEFSLAPGDLITLSAERAAEFVEGHYADYVDTAEVAEIAAEEVKAEEPKPEPKPEPEPEHEPEPVVERKVPEAASLQTTETAVTPPARGRRRGAPAEDAKE